MNNGEGTKQNGQELKKAIIQPKQGDTLSKGQNSAQATKLPPKPSK